MYEMHWPKFGERFHRTQENRKLLVELIVAQDRAAEAEKARNAWLKLAKKIAAHEHPST